MNFRIHSINFSSICVPSGIRSRTRGISGCTKVENTEKNDTDGSGSAALDSPQTHFEDAFTTALKVLSEANDAEGIRLLLEERKLAREATAGNVTRLPARKKEGS